MDLSEGVSDEHPDVKAPIPEGELACDVFSYPMGLLQVRVVDYSQAAFIFESSSCRPPIAAKSGSLYPSACGCTSGLCSQETEYQKGAICTCGIAATIQG